MEGQLMDIPAIWDDKKGLICPPFYEVSEQFTRSPKFNDGGLGEMRLYRVLYKVEWNDSRAMHVATMHKREPQTSQTSNPGDNSNDLQDR